MQLSKKSTFVTFVVAGAIAAGLGGCEKQAPQQQGMRAMPVDVQVVTLEDAFIYTELSGRTTPYCVAEVRPQVSGIILKRFFTEGSEVKQGESLYQIDPAVYKAAVQSARATLAQAEADLALKRADAIRSARLFSSRAVSQQANETAQAQLKVAQANVLAAKAALETAEVNLKYTEVKSPISGRVSLSEVTPGALVTGNQANRLTVVQQLDPIYVDVTQSYEELARLRKSIEGGVLRVTGAEGANVALTLENGDVYPHRGTLMFKDAFADETTGTVRIRAMFPNPNRVLIPGMYARAKLVDGVRERVAKIDQKATMRRTNGAPFVYVVNKDNRIESRDVVIHSAEGTKWILEKGLNEGDKVVVQGVLKVRPGSPVTYGAPTMGAPAKAVQQTSKPQAQVKSATSQIVEKITTFKDKLRKTIQRVKAFFNKNNQ